MASAILQAAPPGATPPAADYHTFLSRKTQHAADSGFEPLWLPDFLKPFQRHLCDWSIRKGRAAMLASFGLGKTPMQLVWAENVVRHTNKPALVLVPLAVAQQTVREAAKFGIDCVRSPDGRFPAGARVVVTNYDRLHHFSPGDFGGAVCDEAGCLKNEDGKRRAEITEFFRTLPYRLLPTATPAPNDYDELGTLSEALGELGYQDMITRFFRKQTAKDYLGWGRTNYKLKGHADRDFWRWVCSWSRAVRRPSDLGPHFDDAEFVLPPLETREHTVVARTKRPGFLIDLPAMGLDEEREERRRTLTERCEKVAELVSGTGEPAVCWAHLNPEGDLIEKLIPDAVQVSGSDRDEVKEERFLAFASGQIRVLVTKPILAAWGLNWQHCAHQTFFPSHSFEQYAQAVHRSLRYGQTRSVRVDMIASEGEQGVLGSIQRKMDAAEAMFDNLVELMNDHLQIRASNPFTREAELPPWLRPPGISSAGAGRNGSPAAPRQPARAAGNA
jgi:hypothetical protein